MQNNIFIPEKIKVGFQKRNDTFTGMLAYIIYYDEKGKLRKEDSWNGWCDKKIPPLEIDNKPQAGFIFNKGVKRDGHWGTGRSVIRVHDARDFEFEISVNNLIGILMHSDVSKRDIVEPCVYAWAGKELVLLPVNSAEYQAAVDYSAKQSKKISIKDIKPGMTLMPKKSAHPQIYMGHFDWYVWENNNAGSHISSVTDHLCKGKKHIFYDEHSKTYSPKEVGFFASITSTECVSNYADLVDGFYTTLNSQPIVGFEIKPLLTNKYFWALNKKIDDHSYAYYQLETIYSPKSPYLFKVTKKDMPNKITYEPCLCITVQHENKHSYHYHGRSHQQEVITLSKDYSENEKQDLLKELFEKHQIGTIVWKLKNGKMVEKESHYY